MTQPAESEVIARRLVDLYGGDPYREVYEACEPHREAHGAACGVYPAEAPKMRVLATLVRSVGARSALEIGGGLGYSALWLAEALPEDGCLETIDRDAGHVQLIERYAEKFGLGDRITAVEGEGSEVLARLEGSYDLVHDDGWFGEQPSYYERMIELLRPGGLLILANCFLLEDALGGKPRMDWAEFAGPQWAENVNRYARALISDPRLHASFIFRPAWVGLAYKRP